MFKNFDFSILENSDFKEDSVREEIITPILRKVGYGSSGEMRVQRSKCLKHPYVMIGSKKHKTVIIPDYILHWKDKPLMVLDAKAPWEKIYRTKNVEQVYSYAIHPEIRCDYYALCNGRELLIYSIRDYEPIFRINISDVDSKWDIVYENLHPKFLEFPELRGFIQDFGLHAIKAGISIQTKLIFVKYYLQDIIKVEDNLFTSSSVHEMEEKKYAISFDYDQKILKKIFSEIPENVAKSIRKDLSCQPFISEVRQKIRISCEANLGSLTEGAYENFVPLRICKIEDVKFEP